MRVVGLGDSITDGYPYSHQDSWLHIVCERLGYEYWNMGINGDLTEGMLSRVPSVLTVNPDLVIVLGGTNDAFHHRPLETVKSNITRIVMELRGAVKSPIVILGLPIPINDEYEEELLSSYRNWMKEFASEHRITVIDFYAGMVDPKTGHILPNFDADGCHPNVEGYKEMAKIAEDVLTFCTNIK